MIDKSTKAVYGISPSALKECLYLEALERRLSGVESRYKEAALQWKDMIKNGTNYDQLSKLTYWMKYLTKAKNLTILQIEEVSGTYISVKGIPLTVEVYGVEPRELLGMFYEDALNKKLQGVTSILNEELSTLFNMERGDAAYEEISKQGAYCGYLLKAKNLTTFQLEELKENINE